MNYLAHCHIAYLTQTSVIGNLLGDFVKGPVANLPVSKEVQVGVQLHRAVDSFTDHHSFTRNLKAELGTYRRYGGIVLDVFFDHQLASLFHRLSDTPLKEFTQTTYKQLQPLPNDMPERFIRIVNAMTKDDWLSGYQHLTNIRRALQGIDSRLKKPVQLEQTIDWYEPLQNELNKPFMQFYDDLTQFSYNFVEKI